MIQLRKRYLILLVIILMLVNFFFPLSASNLITVEKTSRFHDDIWFDEYYITDQEQSKFEFCSKTTMNYHPMYSIDKGISDLRDLDTISSIVEVNSIIDDALMDSCWPMKSQNRHHTGLSPYSTQYNNGAVKWKYESDNWCKGGIAIDEDGVLYFGDFDYYLYALYPNGTLKWRYKTNGWIWSAPALASDGTVYVGTYDDYLYAINHNGTLKWKYVAWDSISSSPAISRDGSIYFGTMGFPDDTGCKIICLNPNGTKKWEYQTGNKIVSDPAIADDGTIYIGSGDSYLYALNPDGTLKWRFKTGDYVKSHPAIAKDGTVYFDSFDQYLYAVYPNGTLKWKYKGAGCGCAGVAIDENGIIYTGGDYFTALYPNGTIKWRYTFGDDQNSHHSSPAVSSDGTIYIGVSKGTLEAGYIYAINQNGTLKWSMKISSDDATSSPCISDDGTVYIGSSSTSPIWGTYGELYAFGRNEVNQAPEPPKITGRESGNVNTQYQFNFTLDDPELDDIELWVDWGDGNNSGWLGLFKSGTVVYLNHTWSEKGSFTVKAKARDTFDGSESSWSTLKVTMPKNKIISNNIFIKVTMQYPLIARLIQILSIKW